MKLFFSFLFLFTHFSASSKDAHHTYEFFHMKEPAVTVYCNGGNVFSSPLDTVGMTIKTTHLKSIEHNALCALQIYDKKSIVDDTRGAVVGYKHGDSGEIFDVAASWNMLSKNYFDKGIRLVMLPPSASHPDISYHHWKIKLGKDKSDETIVFSFNGLEILANGLPLSMHSRKNSRKTVHLPFTSRKEVTLSVKGGKGMEFIWDDETKRIKSETYTFTPKKNFISVKIK